MSDLHVFDDGNGTDCVVAADAEDAWAVWCASNGEKRSDYDGTIEWTLVPEDKLIRIWCDDDGGPTEIGNGSVVTRTAAEWAAQQGRGFLCSTEC